MTAALAYADVLARLEGVRHRGQGKAVALCPCHPDRNPSLSVDESEDGQVLIHCFGCGADYEQVLRKVGLWDRPVEQPQQGGAIVATYDYKDEDGRVLFRKVRRFPKKFHIEQPNGVRGMGGVEPVLYRLPDLADEERDWQPVYICEGEKDADRVAGLGLVATCNFDGAAAGGKPKWRQEYNRYFTGRAVYILADNDAAGRAHAAAVAGSLASVAKSVKVVELEGLPAGGDVSDWLDAGHTKDELERVALLTPAWAPAASPSGNGHGPTPALNGNGHQPDEVKVAAAEVLPLQVMSAKDLLAVELPALEWLVEGLIARGHLVMLAGRPKSGKSWLALQLAMALDSGRQFLGKETLKSRVLLVALEDGQRRIQERMGLLNVQPDQLKVAFNLAYLDAGQSLGPGLHQLEEAAQHYDLIVVDTLIKALSSRSDENSNTQMGAIANELAAIAHDTNTAVVIVHHTGKGTAEDVFYSIRGASALRGAYDVGMVLERKKDEREGLLHVESRDIDGGSYTIRQGEGGVGWQLLGSGVELRKIRAGRQVVMTLMEHGDGVTAEDLAKTMNITRQAAGQQLLAAEAQGLVRRKKPEVEQLQMVEGGVKKKADVWYLM